MSSPAPNPRNTYAFVVGIEHYAGLSPLRGPAAEASRFTDWLIQRGVPAQNISLFLAPLAENQKLTQRQDVRVQPATSTVLHQELRDRFKTTSGDLLLFYWSGHGVIDAAKGARRLAYADATQDVIECLALDQLIAYYNSSLIASFPLQVFIVDACASYFASAGRTRQLTVHEFPLGEPQLLRRQVELLSADDGQAASNAMLAAAGVFSRELLERLERSDATAWPPDLDDIARQLQQHFAALMKAGKAEQTPKIFINEPLAGPGFAFHGGSTPAQLAFKQLSERVRLRYESVFQRADLGNFTGREWLATSIDSFIESNSSGVIVIEANAGLGKTAFLAHLARERGWCHHFTEVAPGADGIGEGLHNLCVQLIDRWQLAAFHGAEIQRTTKFLSEVLAAACRARDQAGSREKIVLVVDALDESAPGQNRNFMGLPDLLPNGAFLLVSHRPVGIVLNVNALRRVLSFAADRADNLADMRSYLSRVAQQPVIAAVLATSSYSPQQFIDGLADKCGGVWIYLKYIIDEVRSGLRRPLELERLPNGIWRYYAEHFMQEATLQEWHSLRLPLLSTLAAVQEDVTLQLLCSMAGCTQVDAARKILLDSWRPYLVISERGEHRYRVYHASLREFLEGRVDREEYTATQRTFVDDLASATKAAHERLAKRYLDAWGGLDQNLIGLQDENARAIDGGYGMRHVIAHLQNSGQLTTVKEVLTAQWQWTERRLVQRAGWRGWLDRLLRRKFWVDDTHYSNAWYEAHRPDGALSAYLSGIARTWRAAEEVSREFLGRGDAAISISLEIRCALIESSLTSLANNFRPKLLGALLKEKIVSAEQGLAMAQRISDRNLRTAALLQTALFLKPSEQDRILQQVLTYLNKTGGDGSLTEEIAGALCKELPSWFQQELADLLGQQLIGHDQEAVAMLVEHLDTAAMKTLLWSASEHYSWLYSFAVVLASMSSRLSDAEARELLGRLDSRQLKLGRLALIRFQPMEEWPSIVQATLEHSHRHDAMLVLRLVAPVLPHELRNTVSKAVADRCGKSLGDYDLAKFRQLHPSYQLSQPHDLPWLIPLLQQPELQEIMMRLQYGGDRHARWMACVAARFAQLDDVPAAISILMKLDRVTSAFAEAVEQTAPRLPAAEVPAIFELIQSTNWPDLRSRALEGIADRLSHEQLQQARAAVTNIRDDWNVEESLVGIAAHLAVTGFEADAVRWAQQLPWNTGRAVAKIAERLPAARRSELLQLVLKVDRTEDCVAGLITFLKQASGDTRAVLLNEIHTRMPGIADERNRIDYLVEIAVTLGCPDNSQIAGECLGMLPQLLRNSTMEYACRRALMQLAPVVNEELLRQILEIAARFHDSWAIHEIARSVADVLPELCMRDVLIDHPSEAVLQALAARNPEQRADALVPLVFEARPELKRMVELTIESLRSGRHPSSTVQEALAILADCGSAHELKQLLLGGSGAVKAAALAEAEKIISGMENPELVAICRRELFPDRVASPDSRVLRCLEQWQVQLPPGTARDLIFHTRGDVPVVCLPDDTLGDALLATVEYRQIIDPKLVARLVTLPHEQLHRHWGAALHIAAQKPRNVLCADLAAMSPLIVELGGPQALVNTFNAIESTLRWWP